jgi:phospholipase C
LKRVLRVICVALALLAAVAASIAAGGSASTATTGAANPIKHVVVIFQENNSFDHLLGKLCVDEQNRCDGTTVGKLSTGETLPLKLGGDIPPGVAHAVHTMKRAIDGGKMDGWDHILGCTAHTGYACLEQDAPERIPTLAKLADTYALSDRTFQLSTPSSWGAHLELVSANLDGFTGDNPPAGFGQFFGWGCDSQTDAAWKDPNQHGSGTIMVPSCVPNRQGQGPYRSSPVQYIPTIMDRLESAGRSWKIYAPTFADDKAQGYGRAICPTFYECLGSSQAQNFVRWTTFIPDAEAGNLPSFSILIPTMADSQHNTTSLMQGDDWIAAQVSAVMSNPAEWRSTAIFITYDDCGCFYDHVPPPKGMGVRVPMVIVSPYAKPRFVDSNDASFASVLAFTEHLYGLQSLNRVDRTAYDYFDSFDFGQQPLPPVALPQHPVAQSSQDYVAKHPPDPRDPT